MSNNTNSDNINWIVDSDASHNITSDLQNLSMHSKYGGNEDIMVGDGKNVPILTLVLVCLILQITLSNLMMFYGLPM